MVHFEETNTPESQRMLANTLGYPDSWYVVRVVTDEADGSQSFYDTIYAGDPKANSDTYYNHLAAMNAAKDWKEGESTPYDNDGGQMLPIDQTVEILQGDEVEVYYEPDSTWYAATVKAVVHYEDDTRYTVKYKVDRSTQDNVCLDKIRFVKAGRRKRPAKKKAAATKKAESKTPASASKKRKNTKTSTKSRKKRS
ncbi:hypothetical protein CTEN210_03366 [Chaetoceros tenuissimus]|uniref:Tudor domain-containing protein n=1 Tax=Chaetoceros tenuissimus TaxID=426638 RepID=A0AAD3H198_9STRA|nr:hypothetical protein CTEN210_03366 [Chaetoceros tenuissimus]